MMTSAYRRTLLALGVWACGVSLALSGSVGRAATIAYDDASNYGGANPWVNGSNGGTGFGAWQFNFLSSGFFYLGDATTNGMGTSGTTNINTAGQSWGCSTSDGNLIYAVRPFTVGGPNHSADLAVGQAVKLDFDNGWIQPGGAVGFSLYNSSDVNHPRFEFFFSGGQSNYTVNDAAPQSTAHGFTEKGMTTIFTLTGPDTYMFQVTFLGDSTTETFTGTLAGTAGQGIDAIRLFNFNAGWGGSNNQYFNSLAIVPEPASLALLGIGAGLMLARRKTLR